MKLKRAVAMTLFAMVPYDTKKAKQLIKNEFASLPILRNS